MSRQPQSGGAGGNFVAVVFVISILVLGAVMILREPPAAQTGPTTTVATLVGRNLLWTPSPTITPTPTSTWTPVPTRTATFTATVPPTATPTLPATAVPLGAQQVAAGERVFQSVCSGCHGFSAQGVPGLGPSMRGNQFVSSMTNDEFLAFLHTGRPADHPDNTSGIPMPARGGNPSLSDTDLMNVISYIRSLNGDEALVVDTRGTDDTGEPAEPLVPLEFTPLTLSGLVPANDAQDDAPAEPDTFFSQAESLYLQSCAGCHGNNGEGVNMLAGPLSESDALAAMDGVGILELFTHPNAGQGYVHPYRGGYPQLSDEQLLQIIGYLYSLTGAE